MNHPSAEHAPEQHADPTSQSPGGLFSHRPEAEPVEQPRHGAGEGADWRATPFSGGGAGRPHRGAMAADED